MTLGEKRSASPLEDSPEPPKKTMRLTKEDDNSDDNSDEEPVYMLSPQTYLDATDRNDYYSEREEEDDDEDHEIHDTDEEEDEGEETESSKSRKPKENEENQVSAAPETNSEHENQFLKYPVTSNFLESVASDVAVIIFTYVSLEDLWSLVSSCKRLYSDFAAARVESLDQLRLWYLNKRQLESLPNINKVKLAERVVGNRLVDVHQQQEVEVPPFEEFMTNFKTFASMDDESYIGKYIVEEVLEFNKNSSAQKLVIAGGSVAAAVCGSFKPADIDIFLMENGRPAEESNEIIRSLLLNVQKKIEEKNIQFMASIHLSTISIISEPYYRKEVQFVLRRVASLEELLTFFDLDIARFAYDGEKVYSTREGLRALKRKFNLVPKDHGWTGMYYRRALKYGERGYDTLFLNIHPLDHLMPLTSPNLSLPNIKYYSRAYNQRTHDEDADMYSCLLGLVYSELREMYETGKIPEQAKGADFTLAPSFSELFALNYADQFYEGYKDSHLLHKYFISKCYICGLYRKMHIKEECLLLKNAMCNSCSKFNKSNKKLTADLHGKVAIVTGARIKIGLEVALKLLRSGAHVIATTRFTATALNKYQACKDYQDWKDRLTIYPLDLKSAKAILSFAEYVKQNFKRVHILINNAAQTVRRPLAYYRDIIKEEQSYIAQQESSLKTIQQAPSTEASNQSSSEVAKSSLPPAELLSLCKSTLATIVAQQETEIDNKEEHFPSGKQDRFGEPLDLRKQNTWTTPLPETEYYEIGEAQMVNAIAPSILVSKLFDVMKPPTIAEHLKATSTLLSRANIPVEPSYVINVTSHEGHFSSTGKTDYHVHTNISKAALNMLTRSSSTYFAKRGILMNSVDTGWISSSIETFKTPPLDCVDGASRILHPIFTKSTEHGALFKNYCKMENW